MNPSVAPHSYTSHEPVLLRFDLSPYTEHTVFPPFHVHDKALATLPVIGSFSSELSGPSARKDFALSPHVP